MGKNKTIIGIVLMALVALTGIYFLFIKKDKKENKDEDKGEGKGEVSEEDKEVARLKAEAEETRRLLDEAARKKTPIAKNDLVTIGCSPNKRIQEIDIVKNDTYNGSFSIEITGYPTKGEAVLMENKIKYTLNTGIRKGIDVIKYKITDEDGESNEASIVIKIECSNYCYEGQIKHTIDFSYSNISYGGRLAYPLNQTINEMLEKGWSAEKISYGAAFLKGINAYLTPIELGAYSAEIDKFMLDCKSKKTKDIIRKPDFADEINAQVYSVGDLIC